MICDHKRAVRLADGWFCPDCGLKSGENPIKETREETAGEPTNKKKKGKGKE